MTATLFDLDILLRPDIPIRRFEPGERIFLEDEDGDAMYVVRSGTVDVVRLGRVLQRISAGGVFGELAIIDGSPRSAAALASGRTEVAVIDKPTFLALVADEPDFALAIMQLVVDRVRNNAVAG